jgi:hypothetical protein
MPMPLQLHDPTPCPRIAYISCRLTDIEITENILLLLLAGHDTSSTTLTRLLSVLHEHPEVVQQLRQEQAAVLARHGEQLTSAAIKDMEYADAVIRCGLLWYLRSFLLLSVMPPSGVNPFMRVSGQLQMTWNTLTPSSSAFARVVLSVASAVITRLRPSTVLIQGAFCVHSRSTVRCLCCCMQWCCWGVPVDYKHVEQGITCSCLQGPSSHWHCCPC